MEEKENVVVTDEVKPATKNPADLKLNYPQTLKVGLGFAVVMIFWTVYNFVVPLLLDQAFGFSNTVRNVIVGIASAMCMVLLPVFGKISDKSGRSKLGKKFGRRTPFIVIGTVVTIIAMILVPLSVSNQLGSSTQIRDKYEAYFAMDNGDYTFINPETGKETTRNKLLAEWFEEAEAGNYSHIKKVDFDKLKKDHPTDAKEFFVSLYDVQIGNGKVMGVIGKGKFTKTTVDIEDGKVTSVSNAITEEEYNRINEKTALPYNQYVSSAANDFISKSVNNEVNWGYFAFFLIALLLIILAQTVIRTPAVSLMPDVTPSPLRSPGNAMINLIGGVGGGIGFLIYTVTFMFDGKLSLSSQYWIIFGTMAGALALVLGLFILMVKEKKWVRECNDLCKEYGLPVYEEKEEEEDNTDNDLEHYIGYLEIPKIGFNRGFYNIASPNNTVESNIQVINGSKMPNKKNGNLIIAGHSGTGWKAFFNDLYQLNVGDQAIVTYKNRKYTYQIENISKQAKTGTLTIKRNKNKTTLTLITCTNNDSTTQTIYVASLVNVS